MKNYSYWQHFLALEKDFTATTRYVELGPANYPTFSIEYVKLLLAVGSEIDVLCKIACEHIDAKMNRKDIRDYCDCFTTHTHLVDEEVLIRRYDLRLKPWQGWSRDKSPGWWKSYNDVKHRRNLSFNKANLENCLNAISALFVLVIYCHKAEKSSDSLVPPPILLGREQEPGYLLKESDYTVAQFF